LTLAALVGSALSGLAQPTTVPPTPAAPQGHVISLYDSSGVYTNIAGVNFEEWWWGGQMTYGGPYTVTPLTNQVLSYLTLYFDGVGFESNPQDVSGCTNLHVDVFTPNGNSFAVRMVDTTGNSADITYTAASGVITNNGWISLNLPLTQFLAATPSLNLHYIQQLGWIINNAGEDSPADYYLDNVYFSSGTNLVYVPPPAIPAPTNSAPIPTQAVTNVLAMYDSSGVYPLWSGSGGIDWNANIAEGWGGGSAENSFTITNNNNGAVIMYLPGLSWHGVAFYDPNQVDASSYNTLHFDLWSSDANQFGIQLVSLDNGGTQAPQVNVSLSATNQWVGVNIPLSEFVATNSLEDLTNLQQMILLDNSTVGSGLQGAAYYLDNIYFYNATAPTAPNLASACSAGNLALSFPTQTGFAYTVQYKTNLTQAAWLTLTNFSGTGSVVQLKDPLSKGSRFYRVSIQ
jgi:hypothetical protein